MVTLKRLSFIIVLIITLIPHDRFALTSGQIVFIRDGNVWIASADETNAKPLTSTLKDRNPSISPDGKLIVFTTGHDKTTGFGRLYSMTPQC